MNTHSYYSPLSERSFSFILFLLVFALFVLISIASEADLTFKIFLTIFGCVASVIFTSMVSQSLYNEVYRPLLRWWHTTRVDRDSEMAPVPLMLDLNSQVYAMYLGELCSGTYIGRSPNGGYSVRLDGGPAVTSSEVYLKLD